MKKIFDWIKTAFSSLGGEALEKVAINLGESKIESVLDDLHDSNPADHLAAITSANAFSKHIEAGIRKTPTNIDDAFLDAINEIVSQQVTKYGIKLP